MNIEANAKKLEQTLSKKPLVPYFNSQSHCHDHKMHMEWLAEALDQRTFSKEAAANNMAQVPTVNLYVPITHDDDNIVVV